MGPEGGFEATEGCQLRNTALRDLTPRPLTRERDDPSWGSIARSSAEAEYVTSP